MTDETPSDVQEALRIAASMIDAGIPIFAAPPCPSGPFGESHAPCTRPGHAGGAVEYDLPAKWQMTIPAKVWLERWRPGWALAAVGGGLADFLDEDPRNNGDITVAQMRADGAWPATFGQQATPSDGNHYVIPALNERKVTGFLPGLDYQGGQPSDGKGGGGQGRGFIWIAPTVKRSKTDGRPRPYRWIEPPDLTGLREAPADVPGVRAALAGWRERRTASIAPREGGSVLLGGGMTARNFSETQAREFCNLTLQRLATAEIGHIEEEANAAAVALSHFVPQFWTEEQAFDVLLAALGETAYDPMHPASTWEADKFHAVLAGQRGRAPGDWYAVRVPEVGQWEEGRTQAAAEVADDAVSALLAEMLQPDQLRAQPAPRHLVRGLLTMDSESWLIGEPGSKKSFVALDLAAHVARGLPWQGRKVQQAPVVLIVAEGAGGVGKRVDAWERQYGAIGQGVFYVLPRPVQVTDLAAWAVLAKACERLAAGLVVIDTQARVTVGLEENSAKDMGVYVSAARQIRGATGACVLTVHHTGRRGGDARGSSAIDGAQDTELKIKPVRRSYALLTTEKQKDIEPADPIKIKFSSADLGKDEEGERVTSLVLLPHDAWSVAEFDDDSIETLSEEAARVVNPYSVRTEPEAWTHEFTDSRAPWERWILQALADVGQDRGLTQAELRDLVAEKVGRLRRPGAVKATVYSGDWKAPFNHVIDSGHPATAAGLVVKIEGADRWTVDRVALKGVLENGTDG